MNLDLADSLLAIFGFHRVDVAESEQTAEYEREPEADTCPGELSLEERMF